MNTQYKILSIIGIILITILGTYLFNFFSYKEIYVMEYMNSPSVIKIKTASEKDIFNTILENQNNPDFKFWIVSKEIRDYNNKLIEKVELLDESSRITSKGSYSYYIPDSKLIKDKE